MEEETRIAVIGIIVEDKGAIGQVNHLLHEYGEYIIGRMGLPYEKKEVNIMQTTASAVVCGSLAIPMIYIAAMYLGEEFNYIGIVIPLFLADVIGICFVVFFISVTKLATSGSHPMQRRAAILGILWSGVAIALFGGSWIVVSFFWNFLS